MPICQIQTQNQQVLSACALACALEILGLSKLIQVLIISSYLDYSILLKYFKGKTHKVAI